MQTKRCASLHLLELLLYHIRRVWALKHIGSESSFKSTQVKYKSIANKLLVPVLWNLAFQARLRL